ncbi:MAG: UDP-3-O-(3-hydroxymyristoyl)glucosamine N-acyltransferase [Planctomycetota bacterium]
MGEVKTVQDVAALVGGRVEGDGSRPVRGVGSLETAAETDIAFLSDPRIARHLSVTKAAAVIAQEGVQCPGITFIRVPQPSDAFDLLVTHLLPGPRKPAPGIHPSSIIHPSAIVAPDAHVGPHCVVHEGARVGSQAILHSHVVLDRNAGVGAQTEIWPFVMLREECTVGERCLLHTGVVIGFDGFGFNNIKGVWKKIPQRGTVEIGDDVEIGANVTIARARFGVTRVGHGSKIDALVQLGHNVRVGRHVYVGSMSGMAGSSELGDHCTVAPQTGIGPAAKVAPGTILGARTGVTKDIPERGTYSGFPAIPHIREKRRMQGTMVVDDLREEVRDLRRRLEQLEQSKNTRQGG